MRTISHTSMVLVLAALSGVGCADDPGSPMHRTNVPVDSQAPSGSAPAASTVTVQGRLSSEGQGTVEQRLGGARLLELAKTVEVQALGANGELTVVDQTTVKPNGAFDMQIVPGTSPTGVFILKVKDLAGAVLGSGVVNGLPAFAQAFVVDAVIDTATSFKAEILTTIAKKGVPGVQNYVNVVDAFVNAEFTNSVALVGVLATDFDSIVGAASDAVIAADDVIVAALKQAGIPVDAAALEKAQSAAVAGLQGLVTGSTGKLVTSSKSLVDSLEAATGKQAAAIDDILFNAIVDGGVAFCAAFKKGAGPDLGFSGVKSIFALETALTTSWAQATFGGFSSAANDAVTTAATAFVSAVGNAKTVADLEAAKAAFTDALLGKPQGGGGILGMIATVIGDLTAVVKDIEGVVDPLAKDLATAFATCDEKQIGAALAAFDAGTQTLPAKLQASVGANGATAISTTLRRVKKQVVL